MTIPVEDLVLDESAMTPGPVDDTVQRGWDSATEALSLIGSDVARVHGLVRDAIIELSQGFTELSAQGERQRDLLHALLRPEAVGGQDAGTASGGRQLERFVAETQQLVRQVVECLLTSGENSAKLASHVAGAVTAMDTVNRMTADVHKVAQHTHIVALNASIEAAHAGKYGAGFAVVAQEVTRLAADSRRLSDQMGDVINVARDNLQRAQQEAQVTAGVAGTLAGNAEQRLTALESDVHAMEAHMEVSLAGAQDAAEAMTSGVGRCVRALQFDDMVSQLSTLSGERIEGVQRILRALGSLTSDSGTTTDQPSLTTAIEQLTTMMGRRIVEQSSMDAGDIELF